ncbi:hypothetical protein FRC08_004380 [Ceratobasidium sp. 394]|nr:hypothetical protein FRC08_004380 [Ceratobasidium sp. 394]
MDTHSIVYDTTFRHWKSARTTLTRAINDYLIASARIYGALSSSACHPPLCHSLETTLSGIDLELPSLQLEEERLRQTRIILANERNKSRALSPVCKLPPEILATVFMIAGSRYTRRDRTASTRKHSSPTVLASVSSSWRRIALATPSLWSYIDLTIGCLSSSVHRQRAGLWVKRSCNVLLYVDISQRGYFDEDTAPEHEVNSLLGFLAPLMRQVCALEMSAGLGELDVLLPVLALWARHASTDIKKTLQIVGEDPFGGLNAVLGPASDGSFPAGELNSFLQSFNRLLVQNCRISETIVFHEGLVELHLQDINRLRPPTQQELVAMLATCPRLRILVLVNCWIQPSDEIPGPVTLNHLQFLTLESENLSPGFVHIFPLLAIGSEGLSMSLTLDKRCNFIDEARAFFGRTKVTRLHVWGIQGHVPLSLLPYPIPHLETLALDYFDISSDYDYNMVLWPRLRTLYLKDPPIRVGCLQQLVQLHPSLQKLHIYRPMTDQGTKTSMTDEECAHLAESMHTVEDFKIEFDWGSRTIGTWDFVILDIW